MEGITPPRQLVLASYMLAWHQCMQLTEDINLKRLQAQDLGNGKQALRDARGPELFH